MDDDDALTIAYQSGYYDGKKAAQRPWVGLTFDEKNDAIYRKGEWKTSYMEAVIEYLEAKLKEKNT